VLFRSSFKNVTQPSKIDREHLVAASLDLLPTICDYAGVTIPNHCQGASVRKLAEGKKVQDWRTHVVTELGADSYRMLRTDRYKYVLYAKGKNREQLFDMKEDRGEMRNLAADPKYGEIMAEHRAKLANWCRRTEDKTFLPFLFMND